MRGSLVADIAQLLHSTDKFIAKRRLADHMLIDLQDEAVFVERSSDLLEIRSPGLLITVQSVSNLGGGGEFFLRIGV